MLPESNNASPNPSPCILLVSWEALRNPEYALRQKTKNMTMIFESSDITAAFDVFSLDPMNYGLIAISSKITLPSSFDILRKMRGMNPDIRVLVALEIDGKKEHEKEEEEGCGNGNVRDVESLRNLPFIDKIVDSSITSLTLTNLNKMMMTTTTNPHEKDALLGELTSMGADIEKFQHCTVGQLHDIVTGLRSLIKSSSASSTAINAQSVKSKLPYLSESDKIVLKQLILSKGKTSSLALSKTLQIPLTTLQRKENALRANS